MDVIAARLQRSLTTDILGVRSASAAAALRRVRNELLTLGLYSEVKLAGVLNAAQELARSSRIATNVAGLWRSSGSVEAAVKATRARIGVVAATESSQAYNQGRAGYLGKFASVRLYKVWDAVLDKRTCPLCSDADGTIVAINERFPLGDPGGVHPLCRCSDTVLTAEETRGETLIQPIRLSPAA